MARIGIDARLPTYQMGGISQYILQLLNHLDPDAIEHHIDIVQMRRETRDFGRFSTQNRVSVLTPCHHRYERFALSAELARLRLDLLHSPDFIPPLTGVAKNVITVHDLNFLHYPQYLTDESRRYYNDQIEWAVEKAHGISADSEHTRQDLITMLAVPPEKVRTIHLAANPLYQQVVAAADVATTLQTLGLPRGFVLAVGTLEPRKNIPTLLNAYLEARQRHQLAVPLVLVGRKGWLYESIFEEIGRLKLSDHVHHFDSLTDDQLLHLYHAAGVLCTPSHYEGFGLPALEAQHCDCPALVSNRGSLPEIVGPDGYALAADDVDLWAEHIAAVCQDNQRRSQMITVGRRQAATFSWQKTTTATVDLYNAVLADAG